VQLFISWKKKHTHTHKKKKLIRRHIMDILSRYDKIYENICMTKYKIKTRKDLGHTRKH